MTPYHKIIATILFFASLFTATINLSAANTTTSNSIKTQSSQVQETKKVLKKKLSLDYTNPKFETDLNKDQKEAILTALKKWKGELPVDNAFTVTSIASLKTENTDINSKVKKSKKETPNAQVVYMWAKSANPNWEKDRIPTGEESEEGDPRFIRTEFNVLLKQTKNGKYKASIERDIEVKNESIDISETPADEKIYQDLFATNLADNALTAITDVLVEPNDVISSLSSIGSNFLSSSLSSSNQSNSSAISSTTSQAISSTYVQSSNSNNSSSMKSISFLDILFGSVKASAENYSWPWKSGDRWYVGQSWHECQPYYGGGNNYNDLTTTGCALDIAPYNGVSSDILAPISGTVKRACGDQLQSSLQIGQVSILHLETNSNIVNNPQGVNVSKSTKIGRVFTPPNRPYDTTFGTSYRYYWFQYSDGSWFFRTPCGETGGTHIHLRMEPITETYNGSRVYQGNMLISGENIQGSTSYRNGNTSSLFTSDNTPPVATPTRPPVYNNNPGTIDLRGNPQTWSLDVQNYGELNGNGTYDQTPVNMIYRPNSANNAQKWQYYPNTKEIKGMNDMCLEAGFANEGDFARVQTCSNNSNQKWTFNSNKTLSIDYTNRCLQYENQYSGVNNFHLVVRNCSAGGNQIWDGNGMNIPAAIIDSNINTVLPPQADYNWAMDDRCGTADNTQVVMRGRNNGDCQKMRYNVSNQTITNPYAKCLDAGNVNDTNNNWLRFSTCNNGNNQKWKQETQSAGGRIWSLQKNSANQTLCIEYQSLTDQYGLNVVPCNGNQGQKWYADVLNPYSESIPSTLPPTLTLKAFLSGPYNTANANMNKGLNPNILPLNEPYCVTPWNYCGGETIATRANINSSFVDWVLVEIRNNSGAIVQQKAGLISQSGYVYDINGNTLTIPNITSSGNYKVIIKHRNHIAVSMNNINFTPGNNTNLNFTNNVSVTASNQCLVATGVYALCLGDVNKDTYIDASDRTIVANASEYANTYSQNDVNLDGSIDAIDRSKMQTIQDRVTNI